MSFDKIKAMRNAERFLSQGKIHAAITEYQRIVEHDPKDFSTLNILGDLYAKGNEVEDAVTCFKQVAEHYSKQGFAQKAIAIYNKVSRLDPKLIDVSEKLAQLYQSRGSFAEARSHYIAVADRYQQSGKKAEALEIWKQIGKLDPNNTEVYLKIAEFCLQMGQQDEACKAYTEAGMRLAALGQVESALRAFSRALEIRQYDLAALNGYVKAQITLGFAQDAAERLERILEQSPYNREILYLLVDCHIDSNNPAEAEKAVIRLVEQEPANYPKFLELVEINIKNGDLVSAARILSMSSEHLLVGGRHDEFQHWANEIIAQEPDQIEALRLLVRYHGWQRDESALRNSLERLAEVARFKEQLADEQYALSQLVLIAPHEIGYAKRLQEISYDPEAMAGFSVVQNSDSISVAPENVENEIPRFDGSPISEGTEVSENQVPFEKYGIFGDEAEFSPQAQCDPSILHEEASPTIDRDAEFEVDESDINEIIESPDSIVETVGESRALSAADELRLSQEIESIEFYVAQGYKELAEKSICALEAEFGKRQEFDRLRNEISDSAPPLTEAAVVDTGFTHAQTPDEKHGETRQSQEFDSASLVNFLEEFRSELGLEEPEKKSDGDFDTHYHTAIAYKEMGLLEASIREFQDAVSQVRSDDGTRRFLQCCNLLGHCFMEKAMPNLAVMWYRRALETPNLSVEESQALLYEVGSAFEAGGECAKAVEYFEQIYAVNVDYRDVGERLASLQIANTA